MTTPRFASIIADSGFTFGVDVVTPVSWILHSRPRSRGVYASYSLPDGLVKSAQFAEWARQNPRPILSYNELRAILRPMLAE